MAKAVTRSAVALLMLGIGVSLTACGGGAAAASAPSATTAPTTSAVPKHPRGNGVTGQITAENGNSWSITTKAGKQFTVTLNGTTKFGTTGQPATQQQFPVGDTIHVTGTVDGDTVTATRIDIPAAPKTSQSPTTTN